MPILCKSKHLPRAHCDQQRDHTRKQNDRGFIPSGRLEENAVQGVAQRLGAHGDSQDDGDHFPGQVRRSFRLDEGHHLHREDGGKHHDKKAADRQHQIIQNSGVCKEKRDPHGKDAQGAGGQNPGGFPDVQPVGEDPGADPAGQPAGCHDSLCEAVQTVVQGRRQRQHFCDQPGHRHKDHGGQKQIDPADHKHSFSDDRVFCPQKTDAFGEIVPDGSEDPAVRSLFPEWNVDKELHDCRQEETDHADPQHRLQPPGAVQQAAQHGTGQRGKGINGVDDRVGRHGLLRAHQSRDAGLYRRLIGSGDAVQKHQRDRQKRNEAEGIHQQRKGQNQRGGQEIQRYHDIPLIDPVCDHAAHGG